MYILSKYMEEIFLVSISLETLQTDIIVLESI